MTLIRVLDLECTGLEPTDEVVEIGAVDVALNTHTQAFEEVRYFGSSLVRPKKPIPPESSAIHHIVDADVADAELWDDVWPRYLAAEVGIFAAHNAAYESQYINEAMRQGRPIICTYKSALRVFPDVVANHKNQTLRYWLSAQSDGGFPDRNYFVGDAHRAGHDALVTAWILVALLKKASLQDLMAWSKEPALLSVCPIGKEWRGKPWPKIEYGFLSWCLNNVEDQDIIWNVKRELERRARAQEEAKKKPTVPDSDAREAYLTLCKTAISMAASIADLNEWFKEQRAMNFPKYGIDQNAPEYKIIVNECAERKAKLVNEMEKAA